jgi:hypothetical protein
MEAQVHITGYAGTEVETRGSGTVSAFRLACTPRIRTKSGWGDGNTTWIEVACFRTLARHVAQSGEPLRFRTWDPIGFLSGNGGITCLRGGRVFLLSLRMRP